MRYKMGNNETSEAYGLYEKHRDSLYKYICRYVSNEDDAEDILSEVYIRVSTKWKDLRARGAPKTWIFRIARNLSIDKLRQRTLISLDGFDPIGVDGLEERTVIRITVRRALNDLRQGHREVVDLCYLQGLSAKEAADVLRISVPACRSKLYRGRRAMIGKLNGTSLSMLEQKVTTSSLAT